MSSSGVRKRKDGGDKKRIIHGKKAEESSDELYKEKTEESRIVKSHELIESTSKLKENDENKNGSANTKLYYLLLCLVAVLSVSTRFYNIEDPPHIWYVCV